MASSYGIDSRHQGNRRHCCSSLPVRHQRIYTFWRCGEHRVLSSATNLDSAVFVDTRPLACSTFAVSVYVAAIVVRAGETARPCSLVFAVPLGSRTKFSELAVSVTSLILQQVVIGISHRNFYTSVWFCHPPLHGCQSPILEIVAVVLSATNVTDCAFEGWSFPADAVISYVPAVTGGPLSVPLYPPCRRSP